jgi:hypothetical protein
MRAARRGRGTSHSDTRSNDQRDLTALQQRGTRRTEPIHLTLRAQPHPFG